MFHIKLFPNTIQYIFDENNDDDDGLWFMTKQQTVTKLSVLHYYIIILCFTLYMRIFYTYVYEYNLQLQYNGQILYGRMVAIITQNIYNKH